MKILFVTGKGGVGKSSFAAALAAHRVSQGKKVLLVEFGPGSQFQYLFPELQSAKGPQKVGSSSGLYVETWQYQEVLIEFITYYLKVKFLVSNFFSSPLMQKLIRVAPGLKELVYLGKATSQFRNIGQRMDYDELVVDAYSTGHFLALLRSPKGMIKAIGSGPMRVQCESILEVLRDAEKTEYYLVTQPDHLTTVETKEFASQLSEEFSVHPNIILNKVKPKLTPGVSIESVEFSKTYQELWQTQHNCIEDLKKDFPSMFEVPFIYENNVTDIIGSMTKSLSESI